jgi:hypothetical protein
MTSTTERQFTAHTPGPWVHKPPCENFGKDRVFGKGGVTVCTMNVTRNPMEYTSNARLIAQAPALVEALRPFAEYGRTLRRQRVRHDMVLLELWDHKITVADLIAVADAYDKATGAV